MSSLPEHQVLKMPALSPTMKTGNIASYKIKVGDKVAPGDLLCEIETDKATIGWESQDEGYIAAILMPEGSQDVPVGKEAIVLVENAADVPAFANYKPGEDSAGKSEPAPAAPQPKQSAPAANSKSYPPHQLLNMPALSPTMTAGTIAGFKVKLGDKISPGDLLCDIETDKATIGWESQDEGYIAKILVSEGATEVAVGVPIFVVVDDSGIVPSFEDFTVDTTKPQSSGASAAKAGGSDQPKATSKPSQTPKSAPSPSQAVENKGGRVLASPLARKLAAENGIDLRAATPTGPHNRVIAADVLQAIESGAGSSVQAAPSVGVAGVDYTEIPHSNIRRVIASRLLESKTTIPHYYLSMDVCVDDLLKLRDQLNSKAKYDKEGKPDYKLSVNDFIIKASALALRDHPEVNVSWMENAIRKYNYIDISVAVASPTGSQATTSSINFDGFPGLITPIVTDADMKGLLSISNEVKALAAKARDGKLQPHEFQGGTFSVSNLGMFGITSFAAIINPPQSCILAVGATEERVVPAKGPNEDYAVSSFMRITLSCDHRTVDGAVGAQFLQTLKKYLSNPSTMLL